MTTAGEDRMTTRIIDLREMIMVVRQEAEANLSEDMVDEEDQLGTAEEVGEGDMAEAGAMTMSVHWTDAR